MKLLAWFISLFLFASRKFWMNLILILILYGHFYLYINLNRMKLDACWFLWPMKLWTVNTVNFLFFFHSGTDQNPRRPVLERFNLYELPLWGKIELMLLDMYMQECYGVFIKPCCVRQKEYCVFCMDIVRRHPCPQHVMDRFQK